MAKAKEVWRRAFTAVTNRHRTEDGKRHVRAAAGAHRKAVMALLSAYADGMLDRGTFQRAIAEEKRVLEVELRASDGFSRAAARATAGALFDAVLRAAKDVDR